MTTPPQFLKELAYEQMRELRSQARRPLGRTWWTLHAWLGSRAGRSTGQPVGTKPVGGKQPGSQPVAVRRPMGCSV